MNKLIHDEKASVVWKLSLTIQVHDSGVAGYGILINFLSNTVEFLSLLPKESGVGDARS